MMSRLMRGWGNFGARADAAGLAGRKCWLVAAGGIAAAATAAAAAAAAVTEPAQTRASWLPAKPGAVKREIPPPDQTGRPRVTFQGELGAYSEAAVMAHFDQGGAIPGPALQTLVLNLHVRARA